MPDVGRGGQNGRGRGGNQVDRATWRLVTALTRQQARRGGQRLFPPRLPLLLIPVESLQLLLPLLDRLDFLGGSFFNTFFVSFQDNIDGMFSNALTPLNEATMTMASSWSQATRSYSTSQGDEWWVILLIPVKGAKEMLGKWGKMVEM